VSLAYPLFAFEKDNNSMRLIEEEGQILSWHETIDIENDECVFWEASGGGTIGVSVGAFKCKLKSVPSCPPALPLPDAFVLMPRLLGFQKP
jgi:hypothetical protein